MSAYAYYLKEITQLPFSTNKEWALENDYGATIEEDDQVDQCTEVHIELQKPLEKVQRYGDLITV